MSKIMIKKKEKNKVISNKEDKIEDKSKIRLLKTIQIAHKEEIDLKILEKRKISRKNVKSMIKVMLISAW